jgi:hypothetical protein
MNATPKTVFSRTLPDEPGWNGTVVRDDLPGAVAALQAEGGKDLYMFGGAEIAGSFMALDLIDEYRLMITPGLLGDGKRLFNQPTDRLGLSLIDVQPLDTGAVILHYHRDGRALYGALGVKNALYCSVWLRSLSRVVEPSAASRRSEGSPPSAKRAIAPQPCMRWIFRSEP